MNIIKILLEKQKVLKLKGDKLFHYQLKKLKKIVSYAQKHSPYYRELFKQNHINGIKNISDFHKIPLLTKKIIKSHFDEIYIKKVVAYPVSTSGSSGEPLTILKDKNTIMRTLILGNPFFIAKYLSLRLNNMLFILVDKENSIEKLLVNPADKFLKLKKYYLNVEQPVEVIVDFIKKNHIESITTYPHMLTNIAYYINNHNIKLDHLKLILLSGEMITEAFISKYMNFFKAIIINGYISSEGGLMGFRNPKKDFMLINYDNVYIEILDENNRPVFDKEGKIVITDLNNKAFPLIRYDGLNDLGIITIANDRPVLKLILGRTMDQIVTPNGEKISPYTFTTIVERNIGIEKFQINQITPKRFDIYVEGELDNSYVNKLSYTIKTQFEKQLKYSIQLSIKVVPKIPLLNETFSVVRRHF